MESSRRPRRPNSSRRSDLLAATEDGSLESLGRLLDAYRPFLLTLARRRLQGDLKAKVRPSDIVQETLRKAFVDFERFEPRGEGALTGWLITLLHARVIDARRAIYAKKRDVRRERDLDGEEHKASVARRAKRSKNSAERNEERERLLVALAQVPEHYAQVIRAHHERQLTFAQIGAEIGRSEEAVRKLWKRAMSKLAEVLETPME